ncbi:MAG: hypothetical protein MJ160_04925 [Treponema sp.]|nr:hypothetical protein [Treponema sp.]
MTDIGKFLSDVDKLKKHDRQNNGGKPDYNRIAKDLRNLFERSTSCPGELPGSIYEYWESQYVLNSADIKEEPVIENTQKLGAMLAFLDNSTEDEDLLTDDDWQEIATLVNYESEELPIDILQELMMILVNHGAY